MAKKKKKPVAAEEGVLLAAVNKKARRDYEILDTLEAGLSLLGSEVKSIRQGGVNLNDAYIRPRNDEMFLIGCHISPYSHSRMDAHETVRDRKLLLHRREIDRLGQQVQQKGLTLVPLKLYFRKGRCKLQLGLGKGKKLYDKREDIKSREANRDMERALRRNT